MKTKLDQWETETDFYIILQHPNTKSNTKKIKQPKAMFILNQTLYILLQEVLINKNRTANSHSHTSVFKHK